MQVRGGPYGPPGGINASRLRIQPGISVQVDVSQATVISCCMSDGQSVRSSGTGGRSGPPSWQILTSACVTCDFTVA